MRADLSEAAHSIGRTVFRVPHPLDRNAEELARRMYFRLNHRDVAVYPDEDLLLAQDGLDHFVIFGATHLDVLCREYLAHYLAERPHQGRENELLIQATKKSRRVPPDELLSLSEIRCRKRLGGLLKSYERTAA